MSVTDRFFKELDFTEEGIRFSVWSPDADEVHLLLFSDGSVGEAFKTINMKRRDDGRWESLQPYDVKGLFYVFCARIGGRWRNPAPGLFATAVGVNGRRAAVIDLRDLQPEGWESEESPEFNHPADAIIYEMHHRDFSVSDDSGIRNKGKFLALTEQDVKTAYGSKGGLSHLVELGVTHVHLLPSFDFASVDESKQGTGQYNWGYDPQNYNVPEGSYSTNPYDPRCRIREFRQMVMALHDVGLRVVMDVVYNHVYSVEDSNFECLVPGYFFRKTEKGEWANGSGCGNETASEREFMRRYMVESVLFWQKEYHIDGFRFDVMGLHDLETMRQIKAALSRRDPAVLLYGEGWSAQPAQIPRTDCAVKANMSWLPGIAAFGDELRDGLRGSWIDIKDGGFLGTKLDAAESVRFGIAGGVWHPQINYSKVNYAKFPWATAPWQVINYVSCHDDLCLADRLQAVFSDEPVNERLRLYKLAETFLFTSQGIPLIFAGDEFFRSKKGVRNSYKSPDSVNAINWSYKEIHDDLYQYIRGLVRMRKLYGVFKMRTAETVRKGLSFLFAIPGMIAYSLQDDSCGMSVFYLYFNVLTEACQVMVPAGNYFVLCQDGQIELDRPVRCRGGRMTVMPRSALILMSC